MMYDQRRTAMRQMNVRQKPEQTDPPRREDCRQLAMVYPVSQSFTDLYTPEEALCAGTLFRLLEFPFHKGFRI